MSNITRARAITLVTFNTNTLHAVNWTVMTPSLEEACFLVRFTNICANTVYISYDGVNPHDVVLSMDYIDIYFQNNASYSQRTNNLGKGTPVYVRGTAVAGAFVLSGYTYVE